MRHGSLFSGIGGFDLAAEWMGWENVFHCEWNPFGKNLLHYYWPNADSLNDITKTDFKKYANKIDILTGGFPCQPYSSAGKRLGKEDERHLWPEMLRAIREIGPKYVVGENVFGLLSWNGGVVFDEVHSDLEAEGYEVQAVVIPAAAVNAPHGRDRVWFVAKNTMRSGCAHGELEQERAGFGEQRNASSRSGDGVCLQTRDDSNTEREFSKTYGFESFHSPNDWSQFPTQSPVCGGDDGISDKLDNLTVSDGIGKPRKPITFSKWRQEAVKAYGNAIVPQVALQIFKAIIDTEK